MKHTSQAQIPEVGYRGLHEKHVKFNLIRTLIVDLDHQNFHYCRRTVCEGTEISNNINDCNGVIFCKSTDSREQTVTNKF